MISPGKPSGAEKQGADSRLLLEEFLESATRSGQPGAIALSALEKAARITGAAGGLVILSPDGGLKSCGIVFHPEGFGSRLAVPGPESAGCPAEILECLLNGKPSSLRAEGFLLRCFPASGQGVPRGAMILAFQGGEEPGPEPARTAGLIASLLGMAHSHSTARSMLAETRDFLSSMSDHSPSGIAMQRAGTIFYLNSKFREIFGLGGKDSQEIGFREILGPEAYNLLCAKYGSFPEGAAGLPAIIYEAASAGGRPLKIGFHCHKESFGGVEYCISWHMDLTERMKIEEDLRYSEQRLREVVDNLPEIYYQTDVLGRFIFMNKTGADRLGEHGVDQPIGRNIVDFYVNPEERQWLISELKKKGFVRNFETKLRTPDGTIFDMLASSRLMRDKDGSVTGVEGVARDITELVLLRSELASKMEEISEAYRKLKEAQSQMIQQEKMASLGTLMAGVAHEITNPVNYIAGNISFIRSNLDAFMDVLSKNLCFDGKGHPEWFLDLRDTAADLKEAASDAHGGMERVKDIVRNLRSFSRVGEPKVDEVNMEEAIDGTVRFLVYDFGDRIEVERKYCGLKPYVCNATEINQVFMNILSNAFQSIEGKGRIVVETLENGGEIQVRISDTGRGISEENKDFIFEPFFSTKKDGVGLGLSISYDIMRRHGGRISFDSTAGTGSTFVLSFPSKRQA